jgi:hypothetical protein
MGDQERAGRPVEQSPKVPLVAKLVAFGMLSMLGGFVVGSRHAENQASTLAGDKGMDRTLCISECNLDRTTCQGMCPLRRDGEAECHAGCSDGYQVCVQVCGGASPGQAAQRSTPIGEGPRGALLGALPPK